jgi:hypothetical protein
MVDRVIEAAASEPVFVSACLELRCGSCTSARRRRLCAIGLLTGQRQHKSVTSIMLLEPTCFVSAFLGYQDSAGIAAIAQLCSRKAITSAFVLQNSFAVGQVVHGHFREIADGNARRSCDVPYLLAFQILEYPRGLRDSLVVAWHRIEAFGRYVGLCWPELYGLRLRLG